MATILKVLGFHDLDFFTVSNQCSDGQTPSGVSLLPFSVDEGQLNEIDHCSEATMINFPKELQTRCLLRCKV